MSGAGEGGTTGLRTLLEEKTAEVEALRAQLDEVRARELGARAELVRSAQLATLGNLIRGVAHEVNTPLGALSSNHDTTRRALEKLQRILDDEVVTPDELVEVRRIVYAITAVEETNAMAMERMKHVVSSLRTFGRPDRSEIDRIDLAEALEGTLDLVKHELGGSITVERELSELPLIECYAQQLNQVFMNLMMNAIHAMAGGGSLSVRTRALEDAVEVEIADTGSGISPENLEKLFEPGFTTKKGRVGMGLGLAICREIVDRHGGRIDVDSELDVGTTFTVRLPLALPGGEEPVAVLDEAQTRGGVQ
ncbi:MAG: ATP-binding protein [Gemmatimonadota bacterium]